MKLIKGLFAIAIVSLIAVSCNDTKKGAEKDLKEAVEATEEVTKEAVESVEETSKEVVESVEETIETTTKGIEEVLIAEGVIVETLADTPVVYPGCTGTTEEIRACSIKKFKSHLKNNFNSDLANNLDLEEGEYKIRAIIKIDETGNASVIKVDAPKTELEKEVVRLIDKLPQMTPATKNGEPVNVSFVLPLNFKVEQ